MTHTRRDPSTPLFFALAAAATALILGLTSGLTFFLDEWSVILRNGWSADALLEPHNEHPAVGPVVVYKLLLSVFGMGSKLPFQVANVLLLVLVAWLVRGAVKATLGAWPALIAAALVLFLGPAWEDLLWPFTGISFLGTIAAGLGALALLDRDETPRDPLVCGLLVISICFSSLGLVFSAGVALDSLLRSRGATVGRTPATLRAFLRRAWVPAVPLALYVLWYAAYGADAESAASLDNLLSIPTYVWTAASTVLASLFGLVQVNPEASGALIGADWGMALLVAGLIGAGILIARDPPVLTRRLWVLSATAATFWALAGLNAIPGREPGASRYQLIGAVLVILIAAELLRGRRLQRPALIVATVLAAMAVVSNIGALRQGERFMSAQSEIARAELAALELARGQVDPGFALSESVAGTPYLGVISAGPYFAAVDDYGSPVDSPEDLERAAEENRARADTMLAAAIGARLEPASSFAGDRGECSQVGLGTNEVPVPTGGALIEPAKGTVAVRLRRYSDQDHPVDLGTARTASSLIVAPDASSQPWVAELDGARATLCPLLD